MAHEALTPREVAELSGAPKRAIEKAIEERFLAARKRVAHSGGRARRMLPAYAVAYAALIDRLDLTLSAAHKTRLVKALAAVPPGKMRGVRVELAPAVELDVGLLLGDVMERAEVYRAERDANIVLDDAILGGTPVIRGTRMTVYSVLGRIDHGDSIDDIHEENPDISRDALEAAVTYARAHPLVGRPGGRPWIAAR